MTLIACLTLATAPADFYLESGDRVLFYGDSITEQRLYTTYVETFVLTRYPGLKVDFFPCGIGGDATWGGWTGSSEERVKRDLAPRKPTKITVMLGMNDGGYVPFDPKIYAIFQEWYGKLLGWMHTAAPGAQYTLIGSSPYDDIGHPDTMFKGYNETVKRFGDYVGTLAKKEGAGYVSFNQPVTDLVAKVKAKNPEQAKDILPDGIHPGPNGHLVMASQLLKLWNADGMVSDVTLDGEKSTVVRFSKAVVTGLKDLAWNQQDESLPFPHDAAYKLALENTDFDETMNRQMLTVENLAPGKYRLSIDDKPVTELDAEAWAKGVNLAIYDTPMRRQAGEVLDRATKRNEVYFERWHKIEFVLGGYPSAKQASDAMAKLQEDIHREEIALAQPKAHRYKLEKTGSSLRD